MYKCTTGLLQKFSTFVTYGNSQILPIIAAPLVY